MQIRSLLISFNHPLDICCSSLDSACLPVFLYSTPCIGVGVGAVQLNSSEQVDFDLIMQCFVLMGFTAESSAHIICPLQLGLEN